jgi:hypothetical protein
MSEILYHCVTKEAFKSLAGSIQRYTKSKEGEEGGCRTSRTEVRQSKI